MSKSKRMRTAEHVTRTEDTRNSYKMLVGKHDDKRPLERPKHRWEHNIKAYLKEVGYKGVDCLRIRSSCEPS
jgi:hypothetical protein